MENYIQTYKERLNYALNQAVMDRVPELGAALRQAWSTCARAASPISLVC
jgi:hypothetical protein